MGARAVDDKPSDTLVVVPGDGFWTGSSTLPHLHHTIDRGARHMRCAAINCSEGGAPDGRGAGRLALRADQDGAESRVVGQGDLVRLAGC